MLRYFIFPLIPFVRPRSRARCLNVLFLPLPILSIPRSVTRNLRTRAHEHGKRWEWDSIEKIGVVPIESLFPSDLMVVRWVYFHPSRLGVIVAQVD